MNKIHRVIWNVSTGTWVVVAENKRSCGKGGGRRGSKALRATLILSGLVAGSALADPPATTVIPASGNTNAYISANGVPVVNIEAANAAGISHNRYTLYNVETNGLVLNNGNASQVSRQSLLAGQVTANFNLVQEATVILNEVVAVNRSTLLGYTEVLGGKADVIVANPYGITCDGCGFINTDRVTLITGTSNVGADGSLADFSVNSGGVLFGSNGIDATAQQILDIVTRSVKIEGNINTSPDGSIGITTGNNIWNYASRNITGTVEGNDTAPAYAITSTVFGGMYAGRIRIIATEAGVGVRMLGEAAASVDDFTITSAGKVEIQSAISAARDLTISSTSASGSNDIYINGIDAKISATHDLNVSATDGQVKLLEGELYAANNMAITAATLNDVSTAAKARYAEGDNTLFTTGEASIGGSVWGAGKVLSGTFDSLSIEANGATIHAGTTLALNTTNDLTLANAALHSTGDLTLSANAGVISTTLSENQGIQTTAGDLSLTAGNGLSNAGTITADTGSVTVWGNGILANEGTIHAGTTLDIADKTGGSTANVDNSGTLLADGFLTTKATSFTNQLNGQIQGTTGSTFTATDLINEGTFVASNTAGQLGTFSLTTLNNSGTLQSAEDLVLNVTDILANTGKLLATNNLNLNAGVAGDTALTITNTDPAVMQAGNALTISGANATFNTQSGTVLANGIDITIATLENSGAVQSDVDIVLNVTEVLANTGQLLATNNLDVNTGDAALTITNIGSAVMQAGNALTISAANATFNTQSGTVLANGIDISVTTLENSGTVQSDEDLILNVTDVLENTGQLLATNNLNLNAGVAGDEALTITNTDPAVMQAGNALTISAANATFNTQSGIVLANEVDITITSLDNSGTVQSGEDLVLNVTDTLNNTGQLLAANNLNLNAGIAGDTALSITNTDPAVMQAGNTLSISGANATFNTQSGIVLANEVDITIASLENSGTVQSDLDMILTISDKLVNSGALLSGATTITASILDNSGTLQSDTDITLTISDNLVNSGTQLSDTAVVTASTLENSGTIQSIVDMTLTISNWLENSGALQSNSDLTVSTGGKLINSGAMQSNAVIRLTITDWLENSGTLQSVANMTMSTGGELINSGTLQSNADMLLTIGDELTNSGTLQSNANMTLNVDGWIRNSGTLLTKGNLTSASANIGNLATGLLQANNGSTITSVGVFENHGTLIASNNSLISGVIHTDQFFNLGEIQSAQNLSVNVATGTMLNSGQLIAHNNLAINSTGASLLVWNTSGGILQSGENAGDTLSVTGTSVSINNEIGSLILSNQLDVNLSDLSNAGTIQGGAAATTINVSNTIDNSGTLTLANAVTGSGTITADTITNTGILQSHGAATFNIATLLDNSGIDSRLLTAGTMKIIGSDAEYTLNNDGQIQSGDLMELAATGGTLTANNGGMISSTGDMTLNAETLIFVDSNSRIVSGADANITLATNFNNEGVVHAGGDLIFKAASIGNSASAAFSALMTLDVSATVGNLINRGALYAGELLTAYAADTFINLSSGTIDSSGDIALSAGTTFINNFTINAANNIAISAPLFKNEIEGGSPEIIMSDYSVESTVETKHCIEIPVGGDYCNDTQDGADTIATSLSLGSPLNEIKYYTKVESRSESFVTSLPTIRPQIIAQTGNMDITGFTDGYNTGGLLSASAGTMTISGTNNFVNEDLSLATETLTTTYFKINIWEFFAPGVWSDDFFVASATSSSTLSTESAGIYANTLTIMGVALSNIASEYNNKGSITTNTPTTHTETGGEATLSDTANGTTATNGVSGGAGVTEVSGVTAVSGVSSDIGVTAVSGVTAVPGVTAVTGVTTVSGAPAISFGGLLITLPTNPNGYYVISQTPNAQYLVETNPLFAVDSTVVGSNYMVDHYGYNPDEIIKRLGDANYEAYLIRQQLISQTGNNIINGYGNEADQMMRLMEQAFQENDVQGFNFGQALTAEQVANLGQDMVWMVETTVAGQKVLAPVVYLASNTRNSIMTGTVIAANTINMDVTSLTNTNGTISGADSLDITAQNDITNSGGTIIGGDIDLTSTEGSVVVMGGNVTADGDATLSAAGDITFDTIVEKSDGFVRSGTVSTETNIGSTLASGGNLSLTSGGDTTIAGSSATVGGDLDVDTGGSFNVIARQDKVTTETTTSRSGLGVGGGLYGTETTTVEDFQGTNVGSTLTVGGNATVKAENEMTVQGSDVNIAGDADIEVSQGINILDGLDESLTTTQTDTTTFLKMDNDGSTTTSLSSSSDSKSLSDYVSAEAAAASSAQAEGTSDLKLVEITDSTTTEGSNTSVASNFNVGGKLEAKTDGTLTIQGSNVESGGDMELDVNSIEMLTGRNEEFSNTETTTTSVGLYNEGSATVSSNVGADANATIGASASTAANASAEAEGTSTFGIQTGTETTTDYKLTNTSSSLKSGGNLAVTAKENATFVGANVESAGDMNIEANNISNLTAQDLDTQTSVKTTQTAGIYVDANVSADASAEGNAQGGGNVGVDGNASANAGAEASVGLRYVNTDESSTAGSITNTGNSFKTSGNFSRTATDTIVDQGTSVEADGNIDQSARVIRDEAIHDQTFSSNSSSSNDARIGVYAEANADASADAGASAVGMTGTDAGAGGEAGAGFKASYDFESASDSDSTKTAVTSTFKAGGNINSTSEEATTLVGTKFESGGDVSIAASSLDYQAAEDSSTSSNSSNDVSADGKVAVYGSAGVKLDAEFATGDNSSSSTTARAGSINAGGNLTINTSGDATFVGTNLEAGNAASIDAVGDLDFQAAHSTTTSNGSSANANVSLSATAKDTSANAGGGYENTDSSSSTAVVGSIKSGSGGTSIKSGGDTSFEGTQLTSTGDTSVDAGGNVNLKAAVSTTAESNQNISGEIGKAKGDSAAGEIGGGFTDSGSTTSTVTNIQSGAGVSIKGNTIVNQESDISSDGGDTVMTGAVVNTLAENSEYAVGMDARVKSDGGGDSKKDGSNNQSGDSSSNRATTNSDTSANPNPGSNDGNVESANPNSGANGDKVESVNPDLGSNDDNSESTNPNSGANNDKIESVNPNSESNDDNTESANPNSGANDDNAESANPNSGANDDNAESANPNSGSNDDNVESTNPNSDSNDDTAGSANPNPGSNDDNAESANPNSGANDDNTESANPNSGINNDNAESANPNSGANDDDTESANPNSGSNDDKNDTNAKSQSDAENPVSVADKAASDTNIPSDETEGTVDSGRAKNKTSKTRGTTADACVDVEVSPGEIECVVIK